MKFKVIELLNAAKNVGMFIKNFRSWRRTKETMKKKSDETEDELGQEVPQCLLENGLVTHPLKIGLSVTVCMAWYAGNNL